MILTQEEIERDGWRRRWSPADRRLCARMDVPIGTSDHPLDAGTYFVPAWYPAFMSLFHAAWIILDQRAYALMHDAVRAARSAEDPTALLHATLAACHLSGERGMRTVIDAALLPAHTEDAHA